MVNTRINNLFNNKAYDDISMFYSFSYIPMLKKKVPIHVSSKRVMVTYTLDEF